MAGKVGHKEVVELLRRVAKGEVVPKLKDQEKNWKNVFAGNVCYLVDGWTVVVFNDCDDWDYIASVVAPDGRTGEFDDWFGEEDEDGHQEWLQPDALLEDEHYKPMIEAFIYAT